MTREEAFASAFKDADIVVVIDDWKGAAPNSAGAPSYFAGRTFVAADPATAALYQLLWSSDAAAWHASGNRQAFRFLFDAVKFDAIFQWLSSPATCLYGRLANVDVLEAPDINARWKNILESSSPEFRAAWDVSSPHASALFWFAELLGSRLANQLKPGARVRLVCDRVDWISSRISHMEIPTDGVAVLGYGERGIRVELLCITNKHAEGASPYLPLLGLVDSEVWAFGRINSLPLREGSTIRDKFLRWQKAGAPQGDGVLSEGEIEQAIEPHLGHANLLAYWAALNSEAVRLIAIQGEGGD